MALYARISEDGTGEGAGVERQVRDAEALAHLRGWRIVERFIDNDVSALRGAHRPGYEALLRTVASGAVDQVVVFQTSRLWRNRGERARDIDAFAAARVGIVAVKGPSLDLSTAYGRGMAGLLGEFDTMESEVKSERVAAAAADRARTGRPNGGLGYGWTRGPSGEWVVDEDEAAIVREVTDRLLAGESLHAVTADLTERGVPTPGSRERRRRAADNAEGTRWGRSSVKKLATRPANAGLCVWHRGLPDETMTEATWPAIVPRERWERVAAKFAPDPDRRTTARPGARRHMLTYNDVGRCGVCGSHLRVKTIKGRKATHAEQTLYACDSKTQCVGRNQQRVDELVGAVVVERLRRPDALAWLAGDDERARELEDRAQALRRRLEQVEVDYDEDLIDARRYKAKSDKITAELVEVERERHAELTGADPELLARLAGPQGAASWDALGVAQRVALLSALGIRVHIERTRPGPVFRPESVRIEWKGEK